MSRRTALLAGLGVVAGLGLIAPPLAHASCTGTGSLVLDTGVATYPAYTRDVEFSFSFGCKEGDVLVGGGTFLIASCGRSSGTAVINGVGAIVIETIGTQFTVTGALTGTGVVFPRPGESCADGTADAFVLAGSLT